MRVVISIVLLTLAVLGAPLKASASPEAAYERVVSEFIRPGFARLAAAARGHEAAWADHCNGPSAAGRKSLEESFHALADAWAEVEMFRSGPAAEEFRYERFYFWPERKNAVERGLSSLLKRPDAASLDAEAIRKESAAVQGLPALERLLHADVPAGDGAEGQLRCKLGQAIASNAAALVAEIEAEWRNRAVVATPEARAMMATDIVTFFAVIKDAKIEAVIGKEPGQVKPRAAEFWRSGRPLRNIQHNLSALQRLNALLFPVVTEELVVPYATTTAKDVAFSLPPDLAKLAAGPDRHKAVLLRDAVDAAEDRAAIEVPGVLGVTIGFNSLDGD